MTPGPTRGLPSASAASPPRVGVGVIVLRRGLVLVGLRQGSHGAGTWALPGGHLQAGESVEQCALREVSEETGLQVHGVVQGPYSNDVFEGRHYVTLFALVHSDAGEPWVLEPDKCAEWRWCRWAKLPRPLFRPLATLWQTGYLPPGAA